MQHLVTSVRGVGFSLTHKDMRSVLIPAYESVHALDSAWLSKETKHRMHLSAKCPVLSDLCYWSPEPHFTTMRANHITCITELLQLLPHVIVTNSFFMIPHQLHSLCLQRCYFTFLLEQVFIQRSLHHTAPFSSMHSHISSSCTWTSEC